MAQLGRHPRGPYYGRRRSTALATFAMITASVTGGVLACDVKPVPSQIPHLPTDGSSAYCVDNTATDTDDSSKYFAQGGAPPLDAPALCFH